MSSISFGIQLVLSHLSRLPIYTENMYVQHLHCIDTLDINTFIYYCSSIITIHHIVYQGGSSSKVLYELFVLK